MKWNIFFLIKITTISGNNWKQNTKKLKTYLTAALADNDTFLTENFTQIFSESWWTAFVISAKKFETECRKIRDIVNICCEKVVALKGSISGDIEIYLLLILIDWFNLS